MDKVNNVISEGTEGRALVRGLVEPRRIPAASVSRTSGGPGVGRGEALVWFGFSEA